MRFRSRLPLVILLAVVGWLGFRFYYSPGFEEQKAWISFEALDGAIQVSAPASWTYLSDLHDTADLQIGNVDTNEFFLALREDKERVPFDSKETYSEFTRKALSQRLQNLVEFGPEPFNVNGLSGILYEMQGLSPNGNQLVYQHAVLEGSHYMYQIVLWTSPERFQSNKSQLEKVMQSFSEGP